MERLRRFKQNAGNGGVFRLLFVGAIFTVIAFAMGWPSVLTWLGGWGLGLPLGAYLAQEPESRAKFVDMAAMVLVVGAFVGGQVKDRMDVDEGKMVAGMALAVGSYLSTYFWFFSSPNVIRIRED